MAGRKRCRCSSVPKRSSSGALWRAAGPVAGPARGVGGPRGGDRSAGDDQLLGDDIALERGALAAAIAARPGHTDPAPFAQLAAEFGGEMAAEIAADPAVPGRRLGGEEVPHLAAQGGAFGRQLDGIEAEGGGHGGTARVWRSWGPPARLAATSVLPKTAPLPRMVVVR